MTIIFLIKSVYAQRKGSFFGDFVPKRDTRQQSLFER